MKARFKHFINTSFAVISFVSIMYEILFVFTGIYSSGIITFILNMFLMDYYVKADCACFMVGNCYHCWIFLSSEQFK